MRLREIQDSFKDIILDANKLSGHSAPFKKEGIAIENRVKVYRNNVIRSLSDTITAIYPMTKRLLGEGFMRQIVREYIIRNLPDHGNLNLYGRSFPQFIAAHKGVAHLPYLPDVAAIEWAWECSTYACDDAAINPHMLSEINEDNMPDLCFELRDSAQLIQSNFPLDKIVTLCRAEEDPIDKIDIGGDPALLMVIRPELEVELRKLSNNEFRFLSALQKKQTIGQAAETILQDDPHFDLGAILQAHFTLGTFSGWHLKK